jgi:hypothetical protein
MKLFLTFEDLALMISGLIPITKPIESMKFLFIEPPLIFGASLSYPLLKVLSDILWSAESDLL